MLTRLVTLRLVSRKLESIAGDLADSAKPLQEMSERHTVQLEDSCDQLLNGLSALGKRQTDLQDTCSGHLSDLVKVICTTLQPQGDLSIEEPVRTDNVSIACQVCYW